MCRKLRDETENKYPVSKISNSEFKISFTEAEEFQKYEIAVVRNGTIREDKKILLVKWPASDFVWNFLLYEFFIVFPEIENLWIIIIWKSYCFEVICFV